MKRFFRKHPVFIPSLASAALLFLAIPEFWPYGYYVFLRWAVCLSAVLITFNSYTVDRKMFLFSSIPIAILFNPIAPVHIDKEIWIVIDIIVGLYMIVAGFSVRSPVQTDRQSENEVSKK